MPQDPTNTPEAPQSRDLSALNPEEIQALADEVRRQRHAAFAEIPPPGPGPVQLPDPVEPVPLLRVRLDLDDAKPPIWRRLELRGDLCIDELHYVIQIAMGWDGSHLHRFWVGPTKRIWDAPYLLTDFDLDEGEQGTPEGAVELSQMVRAVGDRLFYTYDYGDEWNHTIKVEAVEPLPDDQPPAICTGGRNACPFEDVGGVYTHNALFAMHREAPEHSTMHESYAAWLPEDWDPQAFDPEDITRALADSEYDLS